MALPPMGPMSPPSPPLGGPQPNMGPSPMPPMGMGMPPPPPPMPPMAAPMAPPTINPSQNGGQSFGGDAGGRKTFSQYLQSMNTSFPPTPAAPPPMSGGIGNGAPLMPPLAMMGGGAVPRSTMIGREPHRLAYINPGEEMMLRASGGTGEPGPMGVPAFRGGGFSPGFGEGFGFGGGGPGDGFDDADFGGFDYGMDTDSGNIGAAPGDIDPGFIDALAQAAVDNSYFDAFETDPDKLADQVAFESISSQVPDIIGPNAPVSNVDAQNVVALATEAFDPYKDVVDFNTASTLPSIESSPIATDVNQDPTQAYLDSLTKPSIQTGANNFIDAVAMQYNDPNQSTIGPFTGFNIVDAANLSAGTVTPNMMPPGYQPKPDEPTFEGLTSNAPSMSMNMGRIDPNLGAPMAPDYGNLNIDMGTDNLGGVGVGVEDPTFGYNIDMESDPFPGASAFTGLDAQMPTGIQDPSGASNIPQISQAMQNAVTEAPNVNEIANIQAADVYGLPNTGLDTSFSAAQFADTLNPQGPTVTPSIPELTGPALAEATMGAPIGDPAMDRREAAFGDMNTPETDFGTLEASLSSSPSNIDPLSSIDLSMDNLGGVLGTVDPNNLPKEGETQKLNLPFEKVMDLVDDRIAVQKEIDDAGFNPLSLLPFGSLLGTSPKRRQKAITQVLNQSGGSGLLGTGIGGATGVLGTGAVQFNPVYDKDGNFVGSQGVDDKGNTVSYMGDRQNLGGYFDSEGNNKEISAAIEGYQASIEGGGPDSPGGSEGPDEPYNPCQPGFELDPETNTCVPIDVVGGGGGSSEMTPIIRPITPPVTTPVEPDPQPAPVVSPVLRMPKQFNMGGATSGSNLDGAISRLLSSMS